MKTPVAVPGILLAATVAAEARCKDCGCKEKCSPKCHCERGRSSL